jgi:VanZ family protein
LWAVVIFWLSTERFGTSFSRTMEAGFLGLLHLNLPPGMFLTLHTISRKLAHLGEYGVLAFLIYRSFGSQNRTNWEPQLAFASVLAATAYSLTDEFHQLFVPGRGASLTDCAFDSIGAVIAMFLVYAYSRALDSISQDCACRSIVRGAQLASLWKPGRRSLLDAASLSTTKLTSLGPRKPPTAEPE